MSPPAPGTQEWLDQVDEDVIDPDRPIVDPHHHLWEPDGRIPYCMTDLHADVGDGHRIERTVFVECHSNYDDAAPPHLRSLGETRFVATEAAADPSGLIGGIVANVDLCRDDLDDLIDRHVEAGAGLFRGVRHSLAHCSHPEALSIRGRAPAGLAHRPEFRRGVARLGERGLTYDSWHFHEQSDDFLDLARATPGTTMVLDHFGTPLGVGPWADRRDEVFGRWQRDITALADCPNVVVKLGGMAMPDNGYGWDTADRPPTSDEFVVAQRAHYLHAIECFGPERCMFESNFPVDRLSLSYRTVWNAFKKIAAEFTDDEQDAMFRGTATRVYAL